MELEKMTALEIGRLIKEKKLGCVEVVQETIKSIEKKDKVYNAYNTVIKDNALEKAKIVQKGINSGEISSPLAGVPVCIKDNISTKDVLTTCSSKILSGYKPIFNATIVDKLEDAGAILIGKSNMDEFAMGGSTESSFYGPSKNPWNTECVPGGSSGGGAAAVSGGEAIYSIGSDTGGSIRQPCAFCNLTGIKPTYGSVSRYGLIAYASSLDQIGPMGKDIMDCAEVLSIISGKDAKDNTSVIKEPFDFAVSYKGSIKGMKIGVPKNYFNAGIDEDVSNSVYAAAKHLENLGAVVKEFEMLITDYAVSAYYIIACAEASSNLSRYDGIKYGYKTPNASDLLDSYKFSRSEGFGIEVKRRIMLGSFVLSAGYYDAYYGKASQARSLIKNAYATEFEKYDAILSPATPTTAYKLGENFKDPIKMYMGDIYTVSVNLAGLPAITLPCGFDRNKMPIGFQLIGKAFSEPELVKVAYAYQKTTDHHKRTPFDERSGL